MIIQAAIRPDAAAQLIIGGLPNSRLPLLAVLLLLTLGVGFAAVIQLRREQEFQRLREDFVSGVSHELRTPLAQIRMFAELQEAGKLRAPEDQRRAIAVINRESRRLTHLVENILQFSRLRRTPEQRMPKEELDLAEALADGLDAVTSLLQDRGMTLQVASHPGLNVVANRDALTRIVVNLLDNAVKYGPPGQTISVTVDRLNGSARLSVSDEGPGVPQADRTAIWKPYRRLERDMKAQLPGTGIGLSVVSELAAHHDGRAWVDDVPGGGARFVVELPLAATGNGKHAGEDA
jgi:signal transduction histidine kinase